MIPPRYLVGDGPGIMSHGEDRQGQLGLGVARVVTMVIVALLEKGVVCGLIRGKGFPQAVHLLPAETTLPAPRDTEPEVSFAAVSHTSPSDRRAHSISESFQRASSLSR